MFIILKMRCSFKCHGDVYFRSDLPFSSRRAQRELDETALGIYSPIGRIYSESGQATSSI